MTFLLAMKAAWAWCKKHWKLVLGILGGLLVALLGFMFGVRVKRNVINVTSTPGPSKKQQEADANLLEELEESDEEKRRKQEELRKQLAEDVKDSLNEMRTEAPGLVEDSDELNKHLIETGKKVREDG